MVKVLSTWAGRSQFRYTGSVATGTEIEYGDHFRHRARITAGAYASLLSQFSGRQVKIGTSRDAQPDGSVGDWLKANVSKTALASYVGPILIEEGYAVVGGESDQIMFKRTS
jgi:hypothetical protein